jgi:hypothetical protein
MYLKEYGEYFEEDRHGTKRWYYHGESHREDGPAVEWSDGDTEWYLHGELHREDGPASVHSNGDKFYYFHGTILSRYEWEKRVKKCK